MLALDLLRGFFIVVIIVDHLWRWPSLLGFVSGEGRLWVTAGEGFVIISGLLIGYIRGYKNRDLPLLDVIKKVEMRALLLYAWLVGLTIFYSVLSWYVTFADPVPWVEIPKDSWIPLIQNTLLFDYQHPWIHFLYFYTLLLAVTPLAIYLLRKGLPAVVAAASFFGYAAGVTYTIEWLQWTPMFFLPAIAGYYLPIIQNWWTQLSYRAKTSLRTTLYSVVGASIIASAAATFLAPADPLASYLNSIITKQDFFQFARIPIALLWFVGFALFFSQFSTIINRLFGWLLLPLGLRSLTAYILHGSVLFVIAYFLPISENIWYNTLVGILAIIATLALVSQRHVQKIIPR